MINRVPILLQAFYNKRGDLFVIFNDQDPHSSNLPEFLSLRERHVHGKRNGVWGISVSASPEIGPDRRMSRNSSLPGCGQIGSFAKKRPSGLLTVRASLLPLH